MGDIAGDIRDPDISLPCAYATAYPTAICMCVRASGAIEKLADLKLKGPATAMLLVISEAVGPQYVALQLHKKAAAHKNPKVQVVGGSICGSRFGSRQI